VAVQCFLGASLKAGHYITFGFAGNSCILYNDSYVKEISVLAALPFMKKYAYVLHYVKYERQTTDPVTEEKLLGEENITKQEIFSAGVPHFTAHVDKPNKKASVSQENDNTLSIRSYKESGHAGNLWQENTTREQEIQHEQLHGASEEVLMQPNGERIVRGTVHKLNDEQRQKCENGVKEREKIIQEPEKEKQGNEELDNESENDNDKQCQQDEYIEENIIEQTEKKKRNEESIDTCNDEEVEMKDNGEQKHEQVHSEEENGTEKAEKNITNEKTMDVHEQHQQEGSQEEDENEKRNKVNEESAGTCGRNKKDDRHILPTTRGTTDILDMCEKTASTRRYNLRLQPKKKRLSLYQYSPLLKKKPRQSFN